MFDALVILSVFISILITALALVGAYKLLPHKYQVNIYTYIQNIGGK